MLELCTLQKLLTYLLSYYCILLKHSCKKEVTVNIFVFFNKWWLTLTEGQTWPPCAPSRLLTPHLKQDRGKNYDEKPPDSLSRQGDPLPGTVTGKTGLDQENNNLISCQLK